MKSWKRAAAYLLVLVLALAVASPRTSSGQVGTLATYKQGQITFTQGGKEATWRLVEGGIDTVAGTWLVNLDYDPAGKPGPASLMVTITRPPAEVGIPMGLDRLTLQGGPAGNATYGEPAARCTLKVTTLTPAAAEGSGTCTGTFKGGPAITKFAFKASR
jgi:hypothetical protein